MSDAPIEIQLEPTSEKFRLKRDSLSEELRGPFTELVKEYRFASLKCGLSGHFVNYDILAELTRSGWRTSQ